MNWSAFFSSLGDFVVRMLDLGWWAIPLAVVFALIWKHGWPWKKKP